MIPFVQASAALAESLLDDPFYWAITDDFGNDPARRKHALCRYFHYSLEEAERTGRCVVAPDPSLGAAAWLLPRSADVAAVESSAKSEYLASALGSRGVENYYRIVRYMTPLAARVVPDDAWYLSIIGILPSAQGRGLGAALLAGTLAEASHAKVSCYLETFSPRNLGFYERLGFRRVSDHLEPTTNREYVVMRKDAERASSELRLRFCEFACRSLDDPWRTLPPAETASTSRCEVQGFRDLPCLVTQNYDVLTGYAPKGVGRSNLSIIKDLARVMNRIKIP